MEEQDDRRIHGVDLDRTLATYDEWEGADVIGEPIPLMVERVKAWIANGDRVDIFTARVHPSHGPEQVEVATRAIKEWFSSLFGVEPIVTCQKDWQWEDYWDDTAVRVVANTGMVSDGKDVDEPLVEQADGMGEYLCGGSK